MALDPLLRVLAASAFLFLPATAWSAGEEPPSPPAASRSAAAETAKAQALFKAGRFEEALAILRPLAAAGPGHLDIRFQAGMAAIGASRKPDIAEAKREALLDEAIAAFRTMLIADPGLVRVRLELARAFFLKGEDTLATRHFEQVLAGKPPAPVVLNVNRFLSQMRARKRWSLRLGMALAPDSNISSQFGRADDRARHPHRAASIYLSGAATTSPNPVSASRSGPAGNTSTRWRTAGGCARAPTSRAASTARTSSTK